MLIHAQDYVISNSTGRSISLKQETVLKKPHTSLCLIWVVFLLPKSEKCCQR